MSASRPVSHVAEACLANGVSADDLRRFRDGMTGALVIPEFLVPLWDRREEHEWYRILWDDHSHYSFPEAYCGSLTTFAVAQMVREIDSASEPGALGEIFAVDRQDPSRDAPRLALVAFLRFEPLEVTIGGLPKRGRKQIWKTLEVAP